MGTGGRHSTLPELGRQRYVRDLPQEPPCPRGHRILYVRPRTDVQSRHHYARQPRRPAREHNVRRLRRLIISSASRIRDGRDFPTTNGRHEHHQYGAQREYRVHSQCWGTLCRVGGCTAHGFP